MSALSASAIVDQLHDAGLNITLAPAGRLAVAPSSHLTADLRDLIRSSKAMLIDWLTALNAAASHAPDPPAIPLDWKELAEAYHAHHFHCPTCIAAGRGSQYGTRCGVGTALWRAYSTLPARSLARFTDVVLTQDDAEARADKLAQRDRESDDRRLCLECTHLSGCCAASWRCGDWQRAGAAHRAQDSQLPRDLVCQLQRCDCFTDSITP